MESFKKFIKEQWRTINPIDPNEVVYEANPQFVKVKELNQDFRNITVKLKEGTFIFRQYSPCLRLHGNYYSVFYQKLKKDK